MTFDKNQKDFPSEAHKTIWNAAIHILPIEATLPPEVKSMMPPYMAESCEQLQKFFLHILSDLYENPNAYEPFPHGQRLGIQSKFLMPFAEFGAIGEAGENFMTINCNLFEKLLFKQIKSKAYHKDRKTGISVEQRIAQLERTGLKINYDGNNAVLTNTLHPKIFYAMRGLALASVKEKSGGDNSFTYCDFRKLCKKYKYDKFENALAFLSDEEKNIAALLDGTAKKIGLARSVHSGQCPGYGADYSYKNLLIMDINALSGSLAVSVRFLYDKNNLSLIYNILEK
ncbi:MAG: hypothetical protein FWE82_09960, partial [Defluviitaleaceae bacterium]|nr:hypothetical protein [Defluviitaleaceae bacterium]